MKLSHHLTAISSLIAGRCHMPTLEQIDHDLGGLLVLGLGSRGLGPHYHRHQSQDRH